MGRGQSVIFLNILAGKMDYACASGDVTAQQLCEQMQVLLLEPYKIIQGFLQSYNIYSGGRRKTDFFNQLWTNIFMKNMYHKTLSTPSKTNYCTAILF